MKVFKVFYYVLFQMKHILLQVAQLDSMVKIVKRNARVRTEPNVIM